MRTQIPLLQNVRVASPCRASWAAMEPVQGDHVRFCAGCQKHVYNLSEMGQAEAEGLLRSHEGHLCVRYYRRKDGTILTSDCPVGLRAARRLILTRAGVSLGLCVLLAVAAAGYRATNREMEDVSVQGKPVSAPLMGAVAYTSPPPESDASDMVTHAVAEAGVKGAERLRVTMGLVAPQLVEEMGKRSIQTHKAQTDYSR